MIKRKGRSVAKKNRSKEWETIDLVDTWKCFKRYGVCPGDIISTAYGNGIVEGIDSKEQLWFKSDDFGVIYCCDISSAEGFLQKGYKVLLHRPIPEFPKEQMSVNHTEYALEKITEIDHEREGWDVTFVVEEKEVHADSWVLIGVSPHFKELFSSNPNKKIIIDDCSYEVFIELKKYLYSGRITLHSSNALSLYKLAVRMKLGALKNHCELFLSQSLDIHQLPEYFSLIQPHSSENPRFNELLDSMNDKKIFF
ncbi:MAG: BTB/POZ domain-containing protein [Parachlamydiaceae bacterium]|nr:MAG: BTB/POZ domain-containing protein [Parachlamydiaceae bacterium]